MGQRVAAVLGPVLVALIVAAASHGARAVAVTPALPGYVDDRTCGDCHPSQYRRWQGSHHAAAMQRADEATVVGDFGGVTFSDLGQTARFFRRNGRFMVTTEGPDGKPADFEIRYTFGIAPLQQYLVEFPGGRFQVPSIAAETGRGRWFAIAPDRRFALDDPRHWTGRYQNWNLMCAECHSTNLRKGYDVERDSYTTVWDALTVGCQACHGPGGAHVAWARDPRPGRSAVSRDVGLVVDFAAGTSRDQVDACARCHARRVRLVEQERPGRPFLDDFRPQLLRADLYFPDGQQLGEVFEYGSFRQTTMYQRGVRCTDCHDPHAATLRAEGNGVCTRCHRAEGGRDYDAPAHHFHRAGSEAAACVACHMPARTYMGVDARRDHRFPIPRPDLSATLGTPNACTGCHADRSVGWADAVVRRWYGPRRPGGDGDARTIAAGRAGARDAAPALIALAGHPARPAIVRATALDLLREYGTAGVPAMRAATADADPVVRVAAVAGLDGLPAAERVAAVAPLLRDPIRAVRIEAARVLAPVARDRLTATQRPWLQAALDELRASQAAMADMPGSHVEMGLLHEALGEREPAERAYARALRMDPYSVRARTSLATLYHAGGQPARAESVLREGLRRVPGSGELHYSLGLLLAGQQRVADAAEALGHAARLMPDRARVLYNYGVTLKDAGRSAAAEVALLAAHDLDRADADVLYALAILFMERPDRQRAAVFARRLMDLVPDDPRARRLAGRLGGLPPEPPPR
jgi:predicted CXXCH cytochrome family protein